MHDTLDIFGQPYLWRNQTFKQRTVVRNVVESGCSILKQRKCWTSLFDWNRMSLRHFQKRTSMDRGDTNRDMILDLPRKQFQKLRIWGISYHRKVQEMWEWIICGKVWLKIWLTTLKSFKSVSCVLDEHFVKMSFLIDGDILRSFSIWKNLKSFNFHVFQKCFWAKTSEFQRKEILVKNAIR